MQWTESEMNAAIEAQADLTFAQVTCFLYFRVMNTVHAQLSMHRHTSESKLSLTEYFVYCRC